MQIPSRLWTVVGLALLASTALIPLTATVFPTQDGPVHLYYVDVLRGVLQHSAPYAQHFEVKSYLTPYALEYYTLLVFETVLSAEWSEKLLVTLYIFAFGLSFRYLVESVARRGSPWILTGIPFCLHMLVYMGFLNYSFGITLLLFLCGYWIRFSGELIPRRAATVLAGMALMLLTHPVPVLVFLLFTGLYFITGVVQDSTASKLSWANSLRSRRRPLILIAAMAAISLLWVGRFVAPGQSAGISFDHAAQWGWFNAVTTELQLFHVAAFRPLSYRLGPIVLMGFGCAAVGVGFWKYRQRLRPAAIAMIAISGICFLLFCVAPESVNGSYYFAERFPVLWTLFLFAGASALPLPPRWGTVAGALAVAVTACVLPLQWAKVAEIDSTLADVEKVPPAAVGSRGLIASIEEQGAPEGLMFNPYLWGGVGYFRRSRAILANEPWLDLPILMLRPTHVDRWSYREPSNCGARLFTKDAANSGLPQDLEFILQIGPWNLSVDGQMKRAGWAADDAADWMRIYRRP